VSEAGHPEGCATIGERWEMKSGIISGRILAAEKTSKAKPIRLDSRKYYLLASLEDGHSVKHLGDKGLILDSELLCSLLNIV